MFVVVIVVFRAGGGGEEGRGRGGRGTVTRPDNDAFSSLETYAAKILLLLRVGYSGGCFES